MCNHCVDSYITKATSNEISWQGNAVSELDICIGDSLTYVGNIILAKIKDLLKGKGIVLDDLNLNDCTYIKDLLGVDEKNLLNVLEVYKQAICQLKTDAEITQETLDSFMDISIYTLGCLGPDDPCGDPLTFPTLIQAIITKICALNTQLEGIAASMLAIVEEAAGNFLIGGAIKSCGNNGISTSGTGATAVVTFEALVPPYCPIIYTGSTAFFDATGKGNSNTPYCGWYLCNGNNGTPNASTLPQNAGNNIKYIIRFS